MVKRRSTFIIMSLIIAMLCTSCALAKVKIRPINKTEDSFVEDFASAISSGQSDELYGYFPENAADDADLDAIIQQLVDLFAGQSYTVELADSSSGSGDGIITGRQAAYIDFSEASDGGDETLRIVYVCRTNEGKGKLGIDRIYRTDRVMGPAPDGTLLDIKTGGYRPEWVRKGLDDGE